MRFIRYPAFRHIIRCIQLISITVAFIACKKDTPPVPEKSEEIVSPATGSRKQLTLDSLFLYAAQVYRWHDALPAYEQFNPRGQYGAIQPEINALQNELFDITQFAVNPANKRPYEYPIRHGIPRYSYLEEKINEDISAKAAISNSDPVVYRSVIRQGDKRVAYLVLGGFPRLADHQAALDEAFGEFAEAGANELVIDLRNNNGGYVETAAYVANLIAPASLNGKTMFAEEFNPLMQNGKATILQHQLYLDAEGNPVAFQGRQATLADIDYSLAANTFTFEKKGSFSATENIYFIVSGNTASAAELLISCLKPYFNVRLVGAKTYGKPVGFFGINIDKYTVYLSSFLIKNADGWFDYFEGMEPDAGVTLSANPNWGDRNEPGLQAVLSIMDGIVPKMGSLPLSIEKWESIDSPSRKSLFEPKDAIPMLPMRWRLLEQ
ncbi:S41 family peptidase [Parapedobacter sp. GCM10030251]|uniref:S41 family peptidase n=1 Tax=Parapedobacter sp. GCM10030251 TaxID=3273419 RepID=UPI00361F0EF0